VGAINRKAIIPEAAMIAATGNTSRLLINIEKFYYLGRFLTTKMNGKNAFILKMY